MIVVNVRVVSTPESRAATRAALVDLEAPTRAEGGCEEYAWYVSATEPDVFMTVERWTSAEALEAHMQSPHVKAVLAAAGELLAEAPVVVEHEVSVSRTK
ncbi:MAG: putative quinol monooxygenase [Lapillicoccus sp.]